VFAGDIHGRYTEPRGAQLRPQPHVQPRFMTIKRLAMAAASAFLSINLWTGAPLLALWVGSHSSNDAVLSLWAVFVVVLVLAVLVLVMAMALAWLDNTYDELIGRPHSERRMPWLRSMRAEAEGHVSARVGITLLERIVIASVYLAVITLLVWFFLFAGSPLPNGS
jgi:NADH:ubiquinone oxidoreductase subunit 5 (subunit L)/multisubunit Na+/H+ antiporter MnhA subunit